VIGGEGDDHLEAVIVADRTTGEIERIPASALFVLIGAEPRTEWLGGAVERDRHGYILTGRDLVAHGRAPDTWPLRRAPLHLETSVPGIFAAGDVRHGAVKRITAATGEGATAVQLVHQYLDEHEQAVDLRVAR
jgi:thioredoxin reductase (NADPH)